MAGKLIKALLKDLERCLAIIEDGKKMQSDAGIVQWSSAYPDKETIIGDLTAGKGYLLKMGSDMAGYVCLDFNGEEAYKEISGEWLHNGPYAVLHRLAIDARYSGQGLAARIIEELESICAENSIKSLRADTAPENWPMRKTLERRGFMETGIVILQSFPKIAYEKILS